VRTTHGQDGAILLDVREGQMFNINLGGSRILQLLAGTRTPLAEEISREFAVSWSVVQADKAAMN